MFASMYSKVLSNAVFELSFIFTDFLVYILLQCSKAGCCLSSILGVWN